MLKCSVLICAGTMVLLLKLVDSFNNGFPSRQSHGSTPNRNTNPSALVYSQFSCARCNVVLALGASATNIRRDEDENRCVDQEEDNDIVQERSSSISWLNKLDLIRYGVFDEAQLDLKGRPGFTVITGETGSGKSLLISALEYVLSGSNKRNLFREGNFDSSVSLSLGDDFEVKRYQNTHSPIPGGDASSVGNLASKKRAGCVANGKKITAKSLSQKMEGTVNFWSAETANLLDNSGSSDSPTSFISYVDNNLDSRGKHILDMELPYKYSSWRNLAIELKRLESLQLGATTGNDVALFEHYLEEIQDLEKHIEIILVELLQAMEQLEQSALGDRGNGAEELSTFVMNPIVELCGNLRDLVPNSKGTNNAAKLSVALGIKLLNVEYKSRKMLTKFNLENAYKAICKGEDLLTQLDRALSSSDYNRNEDKNGDISVVNDAVEKYSDQLLVLQSGLKSIGFQGTSLDNDMEEAHIALQDANKCLKKATNVLSTLKGSLPNVEHLLDKIIGVRGEWENLIRKHSGSSKETTGVKSGEVLSHLRKVWTENIRSMASLESELPAIRYEEKNAKLEYASLAWELSNKRADSAVDLCDRVNSLLPSLEMSDKRLCVSLVTVLSSIRPAIGDKEDVIPAGAEAYWPFLPELSPLSPLVSSTGWDQLSLSIARPDKSSISLTDSVIATPRVSIRQTLSSGEIARLSLAVETCSLNDENVTHNGDDNDNGKREKTSNSRLVVYDEIDAHVGGEAAVAVARLLKKQGEKRQVIAITHNPVIAAAADFHFVVQREEKVDEKKDQKLPDNQSSMPQSVLKEIYGPIRESELARMTTGKIRTNAGADLAKVLLAEFQNKKSSDPSKIEKLVVLGQDAAKSLLQEQEGSKKKQE